MKESMAAIEPYLVFLLTRISNLLREQGVEAYVVGGYVRDALLGRKTADIDIAVNTSALDVAPRVAEYLGGKYVLLDEVNCIGRVILFDNETKWELDFSSIRGDIQQDLANRDFTVDALAIALDDTVTSQSIPLSRLIDPTNGLGDLHSGIIRAVRDLVFEADPARLLRGVRLSAELGFKIDPETERLIRLYSDLIRRVAGERVREELLRILALPQAGNLLFYLDELNLLTSIIPELAQAKGVEQPVVHYWDVFNHSIETVSAISFLLRQGDYRFGNQELLSLVPWSDNLSQHFDQEVSDGSTRGSILKVAALLHDIAKPQTKATDEEGRTRFLGHSDEGATIASNIMSRLRFSSREIKLVELLVKYHLRPQQMSHEDMPTKRAIYRFFRDTGEAGIDTIFLSLADHLAARGPSIDMAQWRQHTRLAAYVLDEYFREEIQPAEKLVNGHDLMHNFGLKEGPIIGNLLEAVREAQAGGEVNSRDEALAYIQRLLANSEIH